MKKNLEKMLHSGLKKQKQHNRQAKKFKFSSYKEDFVITEQEEKEGGFFHYHFKTVTP